MKPIAIFALIMSLCSIFLFAQNDMNNSQREKAQAMTYINNFSLYRASVWNFSHENPTHEGEILDTALSFPQGFVKNRNWKSFTEKTPDGYYNYTYGQLKATEASYVKDFFSHSILVGINRNGKMEPLGLTLPASIPNNSIISVLVIKGK